MPDVPPGYTPYGNDGKYMRDANGTVFFTPEWEAKVNQGIDIDWWGVAADLALIGLGMAGAAGGLPAAVGGALNAGLEALRELWGGDSEKEVSTNQ